MERKSPRTLTLTQKGQKTNQPYPEVSPYPTMLPTTIKPNMPTGEKNALRTKAKNRGKHSVRQSTLPSSNKRANRERERERDNAHLLHLKGRFTQAGKVCLLMPYRITRDNLNVCTHVKPLYLTTVNQRVTLFG